MPRGAETKQKIISFLQAHPEASRQQIAEALNVSYPTVQRNILELIREEFIEERLHVTNKQTPDQHKFWVLIQTQYPSKQAYRDAGLNPEEELEDYQSRLCQRVAKYLYKSPDFAGVVSYIEMAIVIGGEYDIVLVVSSNDHSPVSDFVTKFLRAQPEVESTMTSWRRPLSIRFEDS